MQPTIYIPLGYPGSGKTFLAKRLSDNTDAVRVSQDSLRKNMFAEPRQHMTDADDERLLQTMNYICYELLRKNVSVIYDANVPLRASRQLVYELAKELGARVVILWVRTPLELAIERSGPSPMTDKFAHDYKQMVDDYEQRFEAPNNSDTVIEIDGTLSPKDQLTLIVGSS